MTFWLMLLLSVLNGPAKDQVTFSILMHDNRIGELVVERKNVTGGTIYTSHSTTKAPIMFGTTVEVRQEVRFSNDVLTYARSVTTVNGNEHKRTEIRREGGRYEIVENGDHRTLKQSVHYSVIQLYFESPGNRGLVFSEHEGKFHRVERQSQHKYLKISEKGRKNYYTYNKEYLSHADMDAGWYRFEISR